MVALRGHHFICVHFLTGVNAGQDFIDNLEMVKVGAREDGMVLWDEIDDVCISCPSEEECRGDTEKGNKVRAMDEHAIELLGLEDGVRYTWPKLEEMLLSKIPDWRQTQCTSCPEEDLCSKTQAWIQLA
jgi:hypothetical protein